jgi:hypothetical protein
LIETISSLIKELEDLFPSTRAREKELCQHEITQFESSSLPRHWRKDPLLREAITTEAKARGMTFEGVTVNDHARVRLGHEIAAGEKASGGTDHVYKQMVFSGDSISQAGNSYGGTSVFTSPEKTKEADTNSAP